MARVASTSAFIHGRSLMCFNAGAGAARREAKEQRADDEARKARIKDGMGQIDGIFGKFDDNFFNERAKAYSAYATPQLDRQLQDQKKNLIFALSRTGNLNSSAANEMNGKLVYDGDVARTGIANEGLNQANALRGQVENTRGNVVAELNATGDSTAAAQAALRNSVNLNTPQGYSPLGNMFANFAQTVGNIGSNAGNNYQGFMGGGTKIFGATNGAQRIVG